MLIKLLLPRFINILQISSYTKDVLLVLSYNNFSSFVTLASTRLRLPEDYADASKHVGMLTKYYLYIYIYIYIYICCAFVGTGNKLYKLHGTYIKIK